MISYSQRQIWWLYDPCSVGWSLLSPGLSPSHAHLDWTWDTTQTLMGSSWLGVMHRISKQPKVEMKLLNESITPSSQNLLVPTLHARCDHAHARIGRLDAQHLESNLTIHLRGAHLRAMLSKVGNGKNQGKNLRGTSGTIESCCPQEDETSGTYQIWCANQLKSPPVQHGPWAIHAVLRFDGQHLSRKETKSNKVKVLSLVNPTRAL